MDGNAVAQLHGLKYFPVSVWHFVVRRQVCGDVYLMRVPQLGRTSPCNADITASS